MRDIARLAKVSISTVSVALQNKPGVSPENQERILRIAKDSGYTPDSRIGSWMARVREASSKDLLPIVWLNTAMEKDAWQRYRFLTPYVAGANERALELGYKLEQIWCHEPGMTMQRQAKILYQRGVEGVIVTFPARHLRLDWDRLATVVLGTNLLAPKLHQVGADLNFNLHLALKSLRRCGFRRIGICLSQQVDSASHYSLRATAYHIYYTAPNRERVPPLFHASQMTDESDRAAQIARWFKRHKPEVIVGHDNRLARWLEAAGYRVPNDVGVINLAVDDDVLDWAGIHSRRRETGATTVEWLVSLMRNRQFGVPKTPLNMLVRGTWQNGRTIKSPI